MMSDPKDAIRRPQLEMIELLSLIKEEMSDLNTSKTKQLKEDKEFRDSWAVSKKSENRKMILTILFGALAVTLDIVEPSKDFPVLIARVGGLLDSIVGLFI